VRIAQDIQYERPDVGILPKRDFGLSLLCASRLLIELVLRRRAEAVANIALRPECRVTGIVPTGAVLPCTVFGLLQDQDARRPRKPIS
jgi:hypothetical protein